MGVKTVPSTPMRAIFTLKGSKQEVGMTWLWHCPWGLSCFPFALLNCEVWSILLLFRGTVSKKHTVVGPGTLQREWSTPAVQPACPQHYLLFSLLGAEAFLSHCCIQTPLCNSNLWSLDVTHVVWLLLLSFLCVDITLLEIHWLLIWTYKRCSTFI